MPVVGASATGLQLADELQRAEDDARDLAAHLAGRLDSRSPQGREKLAI